MKTTVPVPERVAIRSLYLGGMRPKQIAEQTGYTRSAVSRALMTTGSYGLTGGKRAR